MSTNQISPGVQVSITDETQFTVAPTGTIPFILLATAENKVNQSNVLAQYTTPATAGQLYLETSQRSLVNDFGSPIFENVQGTPVNGSELNEYGLMVAYQTLAVSDAAYIMRAPIDLSALAGSLTPPTSTPPNGTIWLDTTTTNWGIFQYNAATQVFSQILPTNASGFGKLWVITEVSETTQTFDENLGLNFQPSSSIGNPGDYAVVTVNANNPVWYMNYLRTWVEVGSDAWMYSIPDLIGYVTNPVTPNVVNGQISFNNPNNTTLANVSIGNASTLSQVISSINGVMNAYGVNAFPYLNSLAISANSSANATSFTIGNAFSNSSILTSLGISAGAYFAANAYVSTFTNVPDWVNDYKAPSGSVWFNTSLQQSGANIQVSIYNATSNTWVPSTVTVAPNDAIENYNLDPIGGGINIPAGTFYMETGLYSEVITFNLNQRKSGPTIIGGTTTPTLSGAFYTANISTSVPGSPLFSANANIAFTGNASPNVAVTNFVTAINNATITGIAAGTYANGVMYVQNTNGGTFFLYDGSGQPFTNAGFPLVSNIADVSNWTQELVSNYVVSPIPPTADASNGSIWYYDDITVNDILIDTGTTWASYRTVTSDARGANLMLTDPNGPIVEDLAPVFQFDGVTPVVSGDLWINTSNVSDLPDIWRYNGSTWIQINNEDHTSINGIIFADARWSTDGTLDPGNPENLVPISTLLTVNPAILDSDAPNAVLYPRGLLLFNTRRSGMNVKQFMTNYLSDSEADNGATWVTASGNNESGVAYQGSSAQRQMVIKSMISAVDNSTQLQDEFYNYNLISCPGYPEVLETLVQLNEARGETAFIVADTPLTLAPDANDLNVWANNLNGATNNGVEGLVTHYDYAGIYYPAGLTTDLNGHNIVVPSTHMSIPTIIQSDAVSYPWFAPAGPRRGIVQNVTSVGYIDSETGDFIPNSVSKALRDVLYPAGVNPISNIPGTGIEVYGQKTLQSPALPTELSRINVARLVIYLRGAFAQIGNQFLFEQNDAITRYNFAFALANFLKGIQAQRGISDYGVDCSLDNNPPSVIDANEMYADVVIAPVTSLEFIFIPVTLVGAGVLSGNSVTTS